MQNPPGKQCRSGSSTVEELILAHAVTSTDQQLVCTMAMVCKDWNMAVQHLAPAGRLHVNLQLQYGLSERESMEKLGSFSEWLSKHARLVSKLEVTAAHWNPHKAWFTIVAVPLFSLALQSAALATAAEAAAGAAKTAAAAAAVAAQAAATAEAEAAAKAAAAAAAAAAEAAQVKPFGMQSYSSDIFHHSAVLQALPAASLTHLQLAGSSAAALAAALPRLSNLQHLDIAWLRTTGHNSVLAAAGQVSTLTSLKLDSVPAEGVTQLPVQLSRLQLCLSDGGPVDMSHLTRLSSLNIYFAASPSLGQVFPAGLVELDINCNFDLGNPPVFRQSNLSQLQSLESLAIWRSRESPEELRQLGALPALRNLSLGYTNAVEANAASPAWSSLWHLKDIQYYDYIDVTSNDLVEMLDRLGSVTQLTRLSMAYDLYSSGDQEEEVYGVCFRISSLHQLRHLTIRVGNGSWGELAWAKGDVNHLSTLSQLTKLELTIVGFAREVVDDLTVVSLLLKLKQLQELRVPVKGVDVFPVIGDLSSLRSLQLDNVPADVQQKGLRELQGLKRLTELQGFGACSKEALADFWNAVRR